MRTIMTVDDSASMRQVGGVVARRGAGCEVIEAADGKWVDHPDLSKVDEIGFTDLMAGSGHGPGGWSDVGRIEVYGKPVKRDGVIQSSKLN